MSSKTDKWWSSLTIAQKERIACKVVEKIVTDWQESITYPACTRLWATLSDEQKQKIHDHCTDDHGYLLKEWKEGNGMSY